MKPFYTFLVLCLFAGQFFKVFSQVPPQCGHCSGIADDVNAACKALGQTGGVIIFRDASGVLCYCNCSCLAFFTPVEVRKDVYRKIGEIKVGEKVLTLSKDRTWVETEVSFSGGTSDSTYRNPYMIYVRTENNSILIATPDHLFLLPDGKLRRADRLRSSDLLVSSQLKPVRITELTSGSYVGRIHNIGTSAWDAEDISTDKHLISTFGVISGDYYLQLNYKNPENDTLPQLGSAKNAIRLGSNSQLSFQTSSKRDVLSYKQNGVSKVVDLKTGKETKQSAADEEFDRVYSFTPNAPQKDPADAVYFIPPGLDSASVPLMALDNTIPYEMAVYLEDHFRNFYPSIEYRIAWTDERVNAFATREGNKRVVTLLGGLIRHPYLKLEGVGLVLAHEIGHHLGGPPFYSGSWASCEGQADYWGAKIGMRKVWWGTYAIEQLEKGSQQLYNLFAYGLRAGNMIAVDSQKRSDLKMELSSICTHPPAQCRLDTYRAAVFLAPKPSCAGE